MYWWWHAKRICWYPLTVARWSNVFFGSLLLLPCLNPKSFTDPCSKMNCARGTGFLDDHLPGLEWQWNMPMCSNWGYSIAIFAGRHLLFQFEAVISHLQRFFVVIRGLYPSHIASTLYISTVQWTRAPTQHKLHKCIVLMDKLRTFRCDLIM